MSGKAMPETLGFIAVVASFRSSEHPDVPLQHPSAAFVSPGDSGR